MQSRQNRYWSPEADREFREILQEMRKFMSTVKDIQDKQAQILTEVARQATINASVKTMLGGLSAQVTDLQNQIAALSAGQPIDQATIDSLASQAGAIADGMKANDDDLAAAVTNGTPATPPAA